MDQEEYGTAARMVAERIERLTNDVNGNPRYRAHWLDFATIDEQRAGNPIPAFWRAKSLGWTSCRTPNRIYWKITSHIGKGELAAEIVGKLHEGHEGGDGK